MDPQNYGPNWSLWRDIESSIAIEFSIYDSGLCLSMQSSVATCSLCHTSIPGPTRLADQKKVRGARPYTRTLYLVFFKPNWYLWVWPTSYNRIKIYTHLPSPIYKYNYTFTFTNQSTEPTCSEPLQVCWPSCMRMSSNVFSCTYTD